LFKVVNLNKEKFMHVKPHTSSCRAVFLVRKHQEDNLGADLVLLAIQELEAMLKEVENKGWIEALIEYYKR